MNYPLQQGTQPVQFTVIIESEAQALATLTTLLKEQYICPLAFCVHDCHEIKYVRLMVSDSDHAEALFIQRGLPYTQRKMIVIALNECPEELFAVLETLHRSECAIRFLYPLFPHPDNKSLIALHTEDTSFAQSILNRAGFKTLWQEDLAR